jgi:hypothetical protein
MEARRLLCPAVAALVVANLVRGVGTSEDHPFHSKFARDCVVATVPALVSEQTF